MQETQIPSLIWEGSTCHRATKPVHHNYRACFLELRSHNYWAPMLQLPKAEGPRAHALQQKKPQQWEARAPQQKRSLQLLQLGKAHAATETQYSQK